MARHSKAEREQIISQVDYIGEMNKSYALVRAGSGVAILVDGPEFELMTVDSFSKWVANRKAVVELSNGRVIAMPLAKYWMEHPDRRQYSGIVFEPLQETSGKYNLWRGFPVRPEKGSCEKFLQHIRDNICGGDEELYLWVLGWFADIFQNPAPRRPNKKSGTSLVLRGPQGTGKSKVGEVFGALLGDYFTSVAKPSLITGTFNMHLRSTLLFQAEEAFWAGSKEAEGILKDLVTGEFHWVTQKYVDSIKMRNYMRFLINGNSDWIVPSGFGERRYAVLDVGEGRMQDAEYFRAIDEEMENGGREALMWEMLNFDLRRTNIRVIPETMALLEQKLETMSTEQKWWMDMLEAGRLPFGCSQPGHAPKAAIYDDYLTHSRKRGVGHKSMSTTLGMFLSKNAKVATHRMKYSRINREGNKVPEFGGVYQFSSLAECRAMFARKMKHEIKWDAPEAEWVTVEDGASHTSSHI
ncbi:primase-helicase family protein [Bradyrhizobium sp. LA7.1]|uniref:primase-helicase family protein n=1 Tax=Bradyrhizobium sp. LA7.1 TaxID=3156324 RepID=UPI003393DF6E